MDFALTKLVLLYLSYDICYNITESRRDKEGMEMQKIVVKEVRGPLGKGEKKFYAVVDEKGAEFTTFDTKIAQVTPGSILEIEPKVEGKYVNIAEWKVLEEGRPSAFPGNGKPAKTPEQLDAERRSAEAIAAYNGIIELMKVDKAPDDMRKLAMDWARPKLLAVVFGVSPKAELAGSAAKSTAEAIETGHFDNAGKFAAAAFKEYGLKASDLCIKFGVKRVNDIADLDAAWKDLQPKKED